MLDERDSSHTSWSVIAWSCRSKVIFVCNDEDAWHSQGSNERWKIRGHRYNLSFSECTTSVTYIERTAETTVRSQMRSHLAR